MNFRHSTTSAGDPQPPPFHPEMLTLGHLTNGISDHNFNVHAAGGALLDMPVSSIQGVQNFLEGTSTLDQNTKLFEQLSTYAKTCGVGIGFHSQSKQVEAAVTDDGKVYTPTDDGVWKQVYPQSTGGEVDVQSRVSAYAASGPVMIDHADTDVTGKGLKHISEMETESASAAKKKSGRVYASLEPFQVRYKNPGKGNQPTTTRYSYAVAKMPSELGNSYILAAKRS